MTSTRNPGRIAMLWLPIKGANLQPLHAAVSPSTVG
jgi:hypothetical protein